MYEITTEFLKQQPRFVLKAEPDSPDRRTKTPINFSWDFRTRTVNKALVQGSPFRRSTGCILLPVITFLNYVCALKNYTLIWAVRHCTHCDIESATRETMHSEFCNPLSNVEQNCLNSCTFKILSRVNMSQHKTCTRTTVTTQNMYMYHRNNTKHVHVPP